MADAWDELVKVLEAETALYRQLLEILGRERAALQHSRRTEIEACTAGMRDLIERLQAQERQRTEVVDRLAALVGRPAHEVTLRLLVRAAPTPFRTRLRRCRGELLELVAQIKAETQRSEALCRHVGELLRSAYGVVKGLAAKGFVYQRGGRMQGARLNGKLVCDEI
jgi:flagellar biosynthesis/type III secretory pathway chaperone